MMSRVRDARRLVVPDSLSPRSRKLLHLSFVQHLPHTCASVTATRKFNQTITVTTDQQQVYSTILEKNKQYYVRIDSALTCTEWNLDFICNCIHFGHKSCLQLWNSSSIFISAMQTKTYIQFQHNKFNKARQPEGQMPIMLATYSINEVIVSDTMC